jgi:hypothetical protein
VGANLGILPNRNYAVIGSADITITSDARKILSSKVSCSQLWQSPLTPGATIKCLSKSAVLSESDHFQYMAFGEYDYRLIYTIEATQDGIKSSASRWQHKKEIEGSHPTNLTRVSRYRFVGTTCFPGSSTARHLLRKVGVRFGVNGGSIEVAKVSVFAYPQSFH